MGTITASLRGRHASDFGNTEYQYITKIFRADPELASVRRLAVSNYRIAMIPTAERYIRAWTGTRLERVMRSNKRVNLPFVSVSTKDCRL